MRFADIVFIIPIAVVYLLIAYLALLCATPAKDD